MSIKIRKVGDRLYEASYEPAHGPPWTGNRPLPASAIIAELLARGAHQQDIGDAFYEADPDWLSGSPAG